MATREITIEGFAEVVEQIGQCRVDRFQLVGVQDGQQRDEMIDALPNDRHHGGVLVQAHAAEASRPVPSDDRDRIGQRTPAASATGGFSC